MTSLSRKNRIRTIKFLALLSIIRWPNVLFTALAQYLSAVFIFNEPAEYLTTLGTLQLHLMVLATICIVSAGFIINSFYDLEKDLVNRPHRTLFNRVISKQFCLQTYFFLNAFGLVISALCSWHVLLYFSAFSFLLWFYSHKLQKIPMVRELTAAFLSVMSVLSIGLYYAQLNWGIIHMGLFIGMLLIGRELIKDLKGIDGDRAVGNTTIPVQFGRLRTKMIYALVSCLALFVLFHMAYPNPGNIKIGFVIGQTILILSILGLVLGGKIPADLMVPHRLHKVLLAIAVVYLAFV
ncbi:MAG: 4-hydroxybenzoate polyprenyltransferase [Bacteroidia bacterium]